MEVCTCKPGPLTTSFFSLLPFHKSEIWTLWWLVHTYIQVSWIRCSPHLSLSFRWFTIHFIREQTSKESFTKCSLTLCKMKLYYTTSAICFTSAWFSSFHEAWGPLQRRFILCSPMEILIWFFSAVFINLKQILPSLLEYCFRFCLREKTHVQSKLISLPSTSIPEWHWHMVNFYLKLMVMCSLILSLFS